MELLVLWKLDSCEFVIDANLATCDVFGIKIEKTKHYFGILVLGAFAKTPYSEDFFNDQLTCNVLSIKVKKNYFGYW